MSAPGEALAGDRAAAHELLRARRRAVHAPSIWQVAQDWYVGVFIGATLLTMVFAATGPAILRPDCDTAVCLGAGGHDLVALGAAALGCVAAVVGLRAVGPLSATAGARTWMLSTPADRAVLLRGAVLRVMLGAAVAGGAWGALIGFAVASGRGSGTPPAVPVVLCAVLGLLLTLVLVPVTMRRQGGSSILGPSARAVTDAELARAGQVVGALTTSTLMLDGAALEVLAARRRLARRGRHPSRPGRGGGLIGLLVHEGRAILRRRRQVLVALTACLGALVVGLLLGRLAGTALAALAAFHVVRASAGGLTIWLTTPGLRRALPHHPAAVTAVLASAPFVLAVVGAGIAVSALGLAWWAPLLIALCATAGAMRASDPPQGLGVVVSTPGGAVHTGLVLRLVHGTDLALLGALGALIGDALDAGPLAVSIGLLLLGWQVLRPRD